MLKLLNIFLFTPFLFGFFYIIFTFLKNHIYIRRTTKVIFSIEFILSVFILFIKETKFSIFGIDFILDKFSSYLIFLTSLVFLLFSVISKTFIIKSHKAFHAISLILFGLINLLILSDNIFASLILLFWLFLTTYFFCATFCEKENKKNIIIQLMSDMFWFLTSTFLILKEFARFFILNNINFSFSTLSENLYKIDDDFSILLAFFGFLILIARMFNFIPFCAKNLSNSTKINPLIYSLQGFSYLTLGCFLFAKTYLNFNFLFYQLQDEIALFLIANFIVFVVLCFRQNNMFKFLNNLFCANIIIGLFSIFSFEAECFRTFAYFAFVTIISYAFSALILIVIKNKFNTDKFEELKRINDKSRLFQFFTTISLLNLASVPLLSFFGAELICFMMIFATDYEGEILNFTPHILIIGAFFIALSVYNIIYKILIEPPEKSIKPTVLSNHQILVFSILTFATIALSFCPNYIFNQIGNIVNIGNF